LSPAAYLYSLPHQYYQQYGIRKFGFHGLSHEAATNYAAESLNKKLNKLKIITCHLGSGSSLTWYMDGKVLDTTMGFSPNEGLTMATRSGDIPADIVLYLASKFKIKLKKIQHILSQESGLYGLCGLSDLRDVLVASGFRVAGYKTKRKFNAQQRKQAKLALEIYLYDIRRYLASYVGMSKKLDAIVFTGKVGVKSAIIRRLSLKNINLPNNCRVIIAPEREMTNLANKTQACLKKK
jgi:acetate kinase